MPAQHDLRGLLREVHDRARLNWDALSTMGRLSISGVCVSSLLVIGLGVLLPRVFLGHALGARVDAVHSMVHALESQGLVPAPDVPLTGEAYERFDQVVRGGLLGGENAHVKLWTPSGEVVYSDTGSEVGREHATSRGMQDALEGQPFAQIRDLSTREPGPEHDRPSRAVVLYVPVHQEGSRPIGVFEVHQDFEALSRRLALVRGAVWAAIGFGLFVLLALLASLFAGTARVMEREKRDAQERAEDLSLLLGTSRSLSSEPALTASASQVLTTLTERLGLRCAAILTDEEGSGSAVTTAGRDALCSAALELARRTCEGGSGNDRLVRGDPGLGHGAPDHRCAVLGIPFQARQDACGAIVVCRDADDPFADRERTLISAVAGQLGFAARNDRLLRGLREMSAVRGRLLRRLVHAQEEERRHLIGDLHDGLGQSLTRVLQGLRGSRARLPRTEPAIQAELERLESLVDEQSRGLRGYLRTIRPAVLEDFGLAAALEAFAREQESESGIRIAFSLDHLSDLDPPTELVLYRAAQEAIMNARKHSGARRLWLRLKPSETDAVLEVEDDGRGATEIRDGMGLASMRDRVASLGGTVEVHSSPGRGTRVRVLIPMEAEHGAHQDVRR
ncbi:MAG TPA: sensor histidine kinase [Actinomycetota bacterium]